MSDRVRVVWDDALRAYDFGPGHPLAPIRVQLAMRLCGDFGLLNRANVTLGPPSMPLTDAELLRVHDAAYVDAVRRADTDPSAQDLLHGLGTPDVPIFPGMHEASVAVCAATVEAARAVLEGGYDHAVNLAGGLHHAMPAMASGFCVYNDIGVAIAWLLDHGVERVAYVDVDVHHGDGVQAMFYDDPRVMTISLHETGRTLFPGTGYPTEVGGPGAEGTAINVALPAGTGDNAWLRAFQAVVPQALEAFRPQVFGRIRRSIAWPTPCATDGGWPWEAGDTSGSMSCRVPGRTSWPRPWVHRWTPTCRPRRHSAISSSKRWAVPHRDT